MERAKTLSSAGVLHDFDIIFSLKVFNQFWVEKTIHQKLKKFRITSNKEFFSISESLAIETFHNSYNEENNLLKRFFNIDILRDDIELIEYSLIK